MKKKLIIGLAAVLLLMQMFCIFVLADTTVASGSCGDGLTWALSDEGVLTISGEGAMDDYAINYSGNTAPWGEPAKNITKIEFSEGCEITHIGNNAFRWFSKVQKIVLPSSVETIGNDAFGYCYDLASVSLPDGLEEIGEYAFFSCLDLKEISIPDSVTYIGEGAFSGSELTSVRLPEGLTEVSVAAFASCASLETVEFPNTVTKIGERAFEYCTNLSKIDLPYSLEEIGSRAFAKDHDYGEKLNILVPPTVHTIAEDAFACLFNLDGYDYDWFHGTIRCVWDSTAYYYASEREYNIEYVDDQRCGDNLMWSVEMITDEETGGTTCELTITGSGEMWDFEYARPWEMHIEATSSIVLPEGLTHIGSTAFFNARPVTEVTIPSTVTSIGGEAFAYSNISTVYMLGDEPEIGDGIFLKYWVDEAELTTYVPENNSTWVSFDPQWGTVVYTEYTEPEPEPDTAAPVISDVWPSSDDNVTVCHDVTLKAAAYDDKELGRTEFYYSDGGEEMLIGTADMNGTSSVASVLWDVSSLSGEATVIYRVYDKAGNYSEETAQVSVRAYTAPAMPSQLTANADFRSADLTWSYTGDIQTLKQFKVYSCDADGDNASLIASVKNFKYTVRELDEGTHFFTVTAEDIYGAQSKGTVVSVTPITTEDQAPTAVIGSTEIIGVTGTPVAFTGFSSTDNDVIVSYLWDFGDGTTGEGVNSTHTYQTPGSYTVTLTVTDRSGNEDSATASVTVYDTLGADATHAVLTVSVMDGYKEGTPAIKNATVIVSNEEGFEGSALTDNNGEAVLVAPKGEISLTVAAGGFNAKVQKIEVSGDSLGKASHTVYLAAGGTEIVGGELTVEAMTYEEIVAAGIDVTNPANNHVVKQSFEIRFQATPELAFDIDIDIKINSAGEQVDGTGFGWHTFTIDPDPVDPNPGRPIPPEIIDPGKWKPSSYTVGVFPVGESAFMVIYGQTKWLKEMFNVELIVYNNSYAEDIEKCVAELELPEGLSLANMLDGSQNERVSLGTIEYIDKEIGGVKEGSPIRTINWYVRGDAEGEYNITASVTGKVGGIPFEKTFTADKAIKVFAGSALELTVTIPKSAYYDKDYVIDFALKNVSDKPIYNLTFGLDSIRQFSAEYLSNTEMGEIREVLDEKDFEGAMTYGLPELEPGDTFNLAFKTKFLYEQEFVEFVMGKIPGTEVGYKVAEIFVTTLDGSTTEIPVKIVMQPVEKDGFFDWIWDETVKALKENFKETVIEFIDDKVFKGIPVVKGAVTIFEIGNDIKDEIEGPEKVYTAAVSVTPGVKCVDSDTAASAVSTYSLHRNAEPGVLVYTDAEEYEISDDGLTMTLYSPGKIYVLRNGDTFDENGVAVEPKIKVTTHYVDSEGEIQTAERTLLAAEAADEDGNLIGGTYTGSFAEAAFVVLNTPSEATLEIPTGDDVIVTVFPYYMVSADGEILTQASNAAWSIIDGNGNAPADGVSVVDGTLFIDSLAEAGVYTVRLAAEGTEEFAEQTITLVKGASNAVKVTLNGDIEENDGEYEVYYKAGVPVTLTVVTKDQYGDVIDPSYTTVVLGSEDTDAVIDEASDTVTYPAGFDFESGLTYSVSVTAGDSTVTVHFTAREKTFTVSFVNEDGTELQTGTAAYGTLPVYMGDAPVKDATAEYTYTFAGWTPDIKEVTGDALYTAVYTETANTYKINYLGLGDGKISGEYPTEYTYGVGAALPADAVRSGYQFCGWYDNSACTGTKITEITALEVGDKTFYARWERDFVPVIMPIYKPSAPSFYTPVINCGENGTAAAVPENPGKGDTVTVTLTPDSGYEAGEIVVTDKNGGSVPVTLNEDGTYSFIQPDSEVTVTVTYTNADISDSGDGTSALDRYADLDADAWYGDAVRFCIENNMMNGTSAEAFEPDTVASRAMIVTILWRLAGEPTVNYAMSFEDVASGNWYTEAIRWAASCGIVNGCSDALFDPDGSITREQLATILYRYEQSMGGGFKGLWMFRMDYNDLMEVSEWSYEAVCFMNMKGIITGKPDKLLDPKGSATRAETAAMLYRYCEYRLNQAQN